MVRKADAEQAIRRLCREWAAEKRFEPALFNTIEFQPSFQEFRLWLEDRGYANLFEFRSGRHNRDSYDVAEHWFKQEFRQTWRN